MGLLDLPGLHWIQQRKLQNEYRRAALEYRVECLRGRRSKVIGESYGFDQGSGELVDNDSGPLFDLIAYQTLDAIDEASYREMQRRIYVLKKSHPLVSGWIKMMTEFIVGDKFTMQSCDEDPKTQAVWDQTAENMAGPWASRPWPFPMFSRELVERSLTFGEDFEREYTNPVDGSLCYRKMHPIWIYNPGAIYTGYVREWTPNLISTFGIQTDPEDLMRILAYYYDPYRNGRMKAITGMGTFDWPFMVKDRTWPAPPVIHHKIGESDMKRGEPIILCVLEYLIELEKILKARRKMHQLRTEVAWWDEIPEGADPSVLESLLDENESKDGYTKGMQYANKPGSSILQNGLKRTYATPSLQAGDGDVDIQRIMKCIAVGLLEAYWLVSGDTNMETQSSLRESTFPQVKSHEGKQSCFGWTFKDIGTRTIQSAIDHGTLSPMSYREEEKVSPPANGVGVTIVSRSKIACPRNTKFNCVYPNIQIRDPLAFAQAMTIELTNKIISRRQWQIESGRDPEQMDKEIEAEGMDEKEEAQNMNMLDEFLAGQYGVSPKNGTGDNGTNGTNGGKNGRYGQRSDEKRAYRETATKS